jgi:RNA polymerase sigma-70 factor (ECF subfamily)
LAPVDAHSVVCLQTGKRDALNSRQAQRRVSEFVRQTRPFHERLYRIALSLCRDRDQAADLTQEALVRAFRSFDSFRPGAPVLPWLARILRNVHLDSFKTGRAQHEVAEHQLDREGPGIDASVAHPAPDPLAALERAELGARLAREMETLDPGQRQTLILCDIEGFSYQEAAEAEGVPVGTIRSRLARGRAELRRRLRRAPSGELPGTPSRSGVGGLGRGV